MFFSFERVRKKFWTRSKCEKATPALRSHQSVPAPLLIALIGLKYDRWKCRWASLLQLINHHQVHSVCPKVTKGYSAAMDTFFALSPARWWMEILSKGKSANPAKTHGCGAGNNYHIWYVPWDLFWRWICVHSTFDLVPSHCFIVDRGWCDNDLARHKSTCLEYSDLEKEYPYLSLGRPALTQNMPSTNCIVDKSS